jgi:hypothetical protein
MGDTRNAYNILVMKPEVKERLGNIGRWNDNIEMYLKTQDMRILIGFIWLRNKALRQERGTF